MDTGKAIATFLNNFEQLTRLPLVTDREMRILFGEDVESAIKGLDGLNREKKVCLDCKNNCCEYYQCEFYAPQLGWCPVFDMRPVICRMHFCQRFHPEGCRTILELYEVFLGSLDIAAKMGSDRVGLFEIPPFMSLAPRLMKVVAPIVQEVREGRMEPEQGRSLVRDEALRYRG